MEYKLIYESKEQAIADLHSKGITDAKGNHDQRKCTLVYFREIKTPAEVDEETGKVIAEPEYYSHQLVDLRCSEEYDFGDNEIKPNKQRHKFL